MCKKQKNKKKKKSFFNFFFFFSLSSVVPRGSQWAALAVKIVDCLGAESGVASTRSKCAEIYFVLFRFGMCGRQSENHFAHTRCA
jgi:hypothetical protein